MLFCKRDIKSRVLKITVFLDWDFWLRNRVTKAVPMIMNPPQPTDVMLSSSQARCCLLPLSSFLLPSIRVHFPETPLVLVDAEHDRDRATLFPVNTELFPTASFISKRKS